MDVLKRHRLESAEKLDQLGLELGLSNGSIDAIRGYLRLLVMVCQCLALPKDECILALYGVHLREILTLWLRMVDDVSRHGGTTWVALDNALNKVDKDTAMKIRKERKTVLNLCLIITSFSL